MVIYEVEVRINMATLIYESLVNGSLLDTTGNQTNTFTPGNSRGFIDTMVGQALEFDHTASLINTGSDFIGTKAITISAWIKNNIDSGTFPRILDNGKTIFRVRGSNQSLSFRSSGATFVESAVGSIKSDTWQHVLVTRSSAGLVNFYVDGFLSGNANQSSGSPVAGDNNVIIGNVLAGTTAFDGRMSNIRVWDGILTEEERNADFAKFQRAKLEGPKSSTIRGFKYPQANILEDNTLIAAYNMTNNKGVITDISGNGYNLTATNIGVVDGINGKAALYDNTHNSIATATTWTGNTELNSSFSLVCNFLYFGEGQNDAGRIYDKSDDNTALNGSYLRFTATNALSVKTYPTVASTANDVLVPGKWYNLIMTHTTAGAVNIYLNNENVLSDTTGALTNITSSAAMVIGNLTAGIRSPQAIFDTVSFHEGILTTEQRQAIYDSFASQLLFYENWDYGADGITKQIPRWTIASGIYKITETLARGKFLQCVTDGSIQIPFPEDRDGTAIIEYDDGTGWATYTDTLQNLIDDNAWLSYSSGYLIFSLSAADKVGMIKVYRGVV